MERCVFILGDSCVSSNDILATVFGVGIVLILLGVYLYRNWDPSSDDDGIQTTNMDFQQSAPEIAEEYETAADGVEEDEYNDQPYDVGEEVFAGEYLDFGVKLRILFYIDDDEKTEVHCKPIIEAPVGATNITTDHTWEGDYGLGMAIIHFTDVGGNAQHLNIGLSDEALEDCNYTVVIESSQSTFDNIKE